jgi:hypothetical protein
MPKLFMRLLRFLLLGLVFFVGGLAVVWTAGELYFDLPAPRCCGLLPPSLGHWPLRCLELSLVGVEGLAFSLPFF